MAVTYKTYCQPITTNQRQMTIGIEELLWPNMIGNTTGTYKCIKRNKNRS